jgi:hypothetical protein
VEQGAVHPGKQRKAEGGVHVGAMVDDDNVAMCRRGDGEPASARGPSRQVLETELWTVEFPTLTLNARPLENFRQLPNSPLAVSQPTCCHAD